MQAATALFVCEVPEDCLSAASAVQAAVSGQFCLLKLNARDLPDEQVLQVRGRV